MKECSVTSINGLKDAELVLSRNQVIIIAYAPHLREIALCETLVQFQNILNNPVDKNSSRSWKLSKHKIAVGSGKKKLRKTVVFDRDVVYITINPNKAQSGRLYIFPLESILKCIEEVKSD